MTHLRIYTKKKSNDEENMYCAEKFLEEQVQQKRLPFNSNRIIEQV